MSPVATRGKAQDRIVEAADVLFDRHGYQSTSVNDIINEAGVSKPTFYAHFPSKEDLCVAYLRSSRKRDIAALKEVAELVPEGMPRFLSPFDYLEARMERTAFRGCRYFNMLSETVDGKSAIGLAVRGFNNRFAIHLVSLTQELATSDPKCAALDVKHVARVYGLLYAGAIMISQQYESLDPIALAREQVAALVNPHS